MSLDAPTPTHRLGEHTTTHRASRTSSTRIKQLRSTGDQKRSHNTQTFHYSCLTLPSSSNMQTVLSRTAGKALVGAAAPPKARPSVALRATSNTGAYEYAKTLPGISQPFPGMFDPAGFSRTASIKDMRRWRESELVHGRVAMLAALGFIIGEQLENIPAFLNADGHITGPAIYQFQQVEARGAIFWEPLLFTIGLAESYRVGLGWATPVGDGLNSLKDEYEMGNLGFDPLGLAPKNDPAAWKEIQTKELNNGRLAMIAVAAFVAQELVSNKEIFEQ